MYGGKAGKNFFFYFVRKMLQLPEDHFISLILSLGFASCAKPRGLSFALVYYLFVVYCILCIVYCIMYIHNLYNLRGALHWGHVQWRTLGGEGVRSPLCWMDGTKIFCS